MDTDVDTDMGTDMDTDMETYMNMVTATGRRHTPRNFLYAFTVA